MFFNSIDFVIFLPIVVLIFYLVPNKAKKYWLLVASYFFYMCWNVKYSLLLFASTLISYLCGLGISKCKKIPAKRLIVAAGLISNLGILFFFKYFHLFSHITEEVLSTINIQVHIPEISLLLPVGISFYTFQAIGYVIDVYRGDVEAEKNFVSYALFVSFFPQLVAGPIERSKNMLPQIDTNKSFDFEKAKSGFLLMLWGFFLKIVIADRIALFVDEVYGNYSEFQGMILVLATVLFAFQIYCDFYGYSIIALGAARILGFELTENFKAPYFSISVAQFWKNWHISLTSWFRDYIYISMGGNKKGKLRKYVNILVVFLISGLWHGAAVSFVVWGCLNGIYQIIGSITEDSRVKLCRAININRDNAMVKLIRGLVTFALVDFSWIFFRANGLRESVDIIKTMLTGSSGTVSFEEAFFACGLDVYNWILLLVCILILVFSDVCKKRQFVVHSAILKQRRVVQWIIFSFAIIFILTFGKYGPTYDAKNFIYFQF